MSTMETHTDQSLPSGTPRAPARQLLLGRLTTGRVVDASLDQRLSRRA
ncbi:MAG: hypothetical protein JWP49_1558 [Phenylobacterium sp.]|nr:hypothetical protein [Phenylobacterium sp.]